MHTTIPVILVLASFGLHATAAAQQPPDGAADLDRLSIGARPDVVRAVSDASVIRVRTDRFEASLRNPRIEGNALHFDRGDLRRGRLQAGLPNPIPLQDLRRVEAFQPHTLWAVLIGAGSGFLMGALVAGMYERQRVDDCVDLNDFTPCAAPLTAAQKRNITLGSVAVLVPVAVLTDRRRFAWNTVYTAPARPAGGADQRGRPASPPRDRR